LEESAELIIFWKEFLQKENSGKKRVKGQVHKRKYLRGGYDDEDQ